MNLTNFHRKNIENSGKNNSSVNIKFVPKISHIKNFSQNIRSDVKTSKVARLLRVEMISIRSILVSTRAATRNGQTG